MLTRAAGEMDVPRGASRWGHLARYGDGKGLEGGTSSGEEYEPGMRLREVMAHDLPRKSALSKSKSRQEEDYEVGGALRNRVNHDGSLRKPNLSEALSSFSARIFKNGFGITRLSRQRRCYS